MPKLGVKLMEEAAGTGVTIDTSGLLDGLSSGISGAMNNFMSFIGSALPSVLPYIGIMAGIAFVIGLIYSITRRK